MFTAHSLILNNAHHNPPPNTVVIVYVTDLSCVQLMEGLLRTLIYTVLTDKGDKAKATPLLCLFVCDQGYLLNLP